MPEDRDTGRLASRTLFFFFLSSFATCFVALILPQNIFIRPTRQTSRGAEAGHHDNNTKHENLICVREGPQGGRCKYAFMETRANSHVGLGWHTRPQALTKLGYVPREGKLEAARS